MVAIKVSKHNWSLHQKPNGHFDWEPGEQADFHSLDGKVYPVTIRNGPVHHHDVDELVRRGFKPNELCWEVSFDTEEGSASCVPAVLLHPVSIDQFGKSYRP